MFHREAGCGIRELTGAPTRSRRTASQHEPADRGLRLRRLHPGSSLRGVSERGGTRWLNMEPWAPPAELTGSAATSTRCVRRESSRSAPLAHMSVGKRRFNRDARCRGHTHRARPKRVVASAEHLRPRPRHGQSRRARPRQLHAGYPQGACAPQEVQRRPWRTPGGVHPHRLRVQLRPSRERPVGLPTLTLRGGSARATHYGWADLPCRVGHARVSYSPRQNSPTSISSAW